MFAGLGLLAKVSYICSAFKDHSAYFRPGAMHSNMGAFIPAVPVHGTMMSPEYIADIYQK